MQKLYILLLVFSLVGIVDSVYLTYEYYSHVIPPCSINPLFSDCGKVLGSQYATLMGLPLSLWGIIHYSILLLMSLLTWLSGKKIWKRILIFFAASGLSVSGYLVYLQIIVLQAVCLYCMISALNSLVIFSVTYSFWFKRKL